MKFRNILALLLYKKKSRAEYYKKLKRRDAYSGENLYFTQWKKLKKLLNYCYYKIPYYEKLFKTLDIHPDDIKTLRDFRQIPELDKAAILENNYELINPELRKSSLLSAYISSSSGIPAKIYHTFNDMEYMQAIRARSNSWCGWDYSDKTYWITTSKNKFSLSNNKANTKNISPASMSFWAKQIKMYKPKYLYGDPSLIEEFSEFLSEKRISFEGIKAVITRAEPLAQRTLIARVFKAPVYAEYGCQEVPYIAHECPKGNMHVNIDEVLVELEDANHGGKNLICSPLYAYGMPLLRYNTQDMVIAVRDGDSCECGLPYPVIELKRERTNDNLLSSNGKLVPGSVISSSISVATSGVRQFQVVQKDLQSITVKISTSECSGEKNEHNIKKLFYELMETNLLKINFEYHERIPADIDGKFRPVISNIINNLNYKKNIRCKPLNVCK